MYYIILSPVRSCHLLPNRFINSSLKLPIHCVALLTEVILVHVTVTC